LRLTPIGPDGARHLWRVLSDPAVAESYGADPTLAQVEQIAMAIGLSWRRHGVHKWLAYDRVTGDVVGRGGCSRVPVDADWGRLYQFLPDEAWVREPHPERTPVVVHANWVEIGWALRRRYWGQGYATEIGNAGLDFAFTTLGLRAVVSCTELENVRSRAVMERLGMQHAGRIGGDGPTEDVPDDTPYSVHTLFRADWRNSK
jgi:RimJ/RimL family protein N-acetyltransferase